MQVKFAEALKNAMSRAASEASADMEGQWLVRLEEKTAEYVRREKQLVADLNAERERTRALQDRVVDMERHTAQTTAELDVLKRENSSLHGSLSRARDEVRRPVSFSEPTIQYQQQMEQQQQQIHQSFNSSASFMPPPAPSTSFLGNASFGLPPQQASLDDSRRVLAIQNQLQLMRAKADAVISMSTTNHSHHSKRMAAAAGRGGRGGGYQNENSMRGGGGIGPETSVVSMSMLSDVTQENGMDMDDEIAPVRGVSHKTSQILAALNLNTSVGQSRPGLSVGLGQMPVDGGRMSIGSQLAVSPSTSPARASRGGGGGAAGALDQKQSQGYGPLQSSRVGGGRASGTGWYQRGYWKTRYNLGGSIRR